MERLTELKYYITKLDAKIKNMQERIEKMAFDDKAEVGVKFLASTVSYLKELREYKQLEEQGLLLRLPCKIGSEVWEIERQFWIDRKGCEDCIYFGNDGLGDYCDYDEDSPSACTKIVPKRFNIRMLDDFGKTVFLTQAEAEQKLKEMESD